ncbi:MAG: metalloregulator ArsR/SmtB family transcription factor [Micrococcus sp.]|nr:metalloregulator ArsR/SmtB family transcription factor [Micrococcus sp.]
MGDDATLPLVDDEVDRIFRALADATRRDIVRRTLTEEITVSALAAAYEMSFAAVQKHVSVLESAGLVNKNRHGRERLVRGNPDTLRKAQLLLDQYEELWRGRIDRLDALLTGEPAGDPTGDLAGGPPADPAPGSP